MQCGSFINTEILVQFNEAFPQPQPPFPSQFNTFSVYIDCFCM